MNVTRARSNTMPNPPPSVRTINIDSHKIEANDSLVSGNNNMIFGNNNRVAGDYNKIYGNNNVVVGSGNLLKGQNNSARGTSNEVIDPFAANQLPPAAPLFSSPPAAFSPPPTTFSPAAFSPPPFSPPQQHVFTPTAVDSPRSSSNNNSYFQPIQVTPTTPRAASPNPYPSSPSPVHFQSQGGYGSQGFQQQQQGGAYFQPVSPQPAGYILVPQSPNYVNPFQAPQSPTPYSNPFDASAKEKKSDIIQDGTLVFMINECEAEHAQEFCDLITSKSGNKVAWHNSVGRTCIVGLGDLEKIRDTIINNLPLLNLRLMEWSWNSYGKRVCTDKQVFQKKMFKEYTREDVDCWRKKTGTVKSSA